MRLDVESFDCSLDLRHLNGPFECMLDGGHVIGQLKLTNCKVFSNTGLRHVELRLSF